MRYDNGYSDYLEVLDTERSLFSAELALTSARGDGYRALVDLYRALGGDWIGRHRAAVRSAATAADGRDATWPTESPHFTVLMPATRTRCRHRPPRPRNQPPPNRLQAAKAAARAGSPGSCG